ncbi:hypothetical protein VP01_323g7 [Puccinia sorghi]|uniref:Xrn1 helical domain-containing protein n=1 Tax=Puccinia sorghi TaxID=27349 RepID=A0A0L6V003_9BASI|nr:hypothetical protein VP01_323g7 [Puccinia sorghi]
MLVACNPQESRELIIGLESPIVDLYPLCDSKMDVHGKNFNWEAIFKIPFTYQERILESMKGQIGKFNPSIWEPMSTNFWMKNVGEMTFYQFKNFKTIQKYLSSIHPPSLGLQLIKGLCKGFLLGKDSIYGFPTLHNLSHTGNQRHIVPGKWKLRERV